MCFTYPSALCALLALRALLTHFMYAPCASFSQALRALFVHVRVKRTIFQELLKSRKIV